MNTGQLLLVLNLIYFISHLYFTYKLSFLFHSLLENGARMTPKRRSVFSLIFIVNCISKFNFIRSLGVRDFYVWGLVLLRWGVSNSYV